MSRYTQMPFFNVMPCTITASPFYTAMDDPGLPASSIGSPTLVRGDKRLRSDLFQQLGSEALDFDDGGVCGELHVVLQRSAAEFVTVDVEQCELAAK